MRHKLIFTLAALLLTPPAALHAADQLSPARISPASSAATGWTKFAGNPVLGGKLGTCFDVSLLKEDDNFRMWFSWRPKKSIALVES